MNRSLNFVIAITGLGFTLCGILLHVFIERVDLWSQFTGEIHPWDSALIAAGVTPFITVTFYCIMKYVPFFDSVSELNRSVIRQMKPSTLQIIGISIAAGVGEEILFRGVLQPVLGIIISSVFFAGLHTGFRFHSPVLRRYFVSILALSMIIGQLYKIFGLPTVIASHALWDFTMLLLIRHEVQKSGCRADSSGSSPDKESSQNNK